MFSERVQNAGYKNVDKGKTKSLKILQTERRLCRIVLSLEKKHDELMEKTRVELFTFSITKDKLVLCKC